MKIVVKEKKTFQAKLVNLYQILIWVKERIAKYFSQRVLEKVELATEEAIVNIIKHGYKDKQGTIHIQVLVNEELVIVIKDKAPKFNPLTKRRKISPIKNINKLKEGGLGIFFIFQCMDEVKYERKKDHNILTLKKKRNLQY